jgi:ribosomal protein S18 acetylase RimI-like enzyme
MEPFAEYTHACDPVGVIATFVDLEHRRQGIGKRLFEATFGAARRKGYEKIFTYVRGDNLEALMAYMKCGFRIIGTSARHVKIGDRYVDEIMIEKFL